MCLYIIFNSINHSFLWILITLHSTSLLPVIPNILLYNLIAFDSSFASDFPSNSIQILHVSIDYVLHKICYHVLLLIIYFLCNYSYPISISMVDLPWIHIEIPEMLVFLLHIYHLLTVHISLILIHHSTSVLSMMFHWTK